MRRYHFPYKGLQYLLNTNTGEIHDLDNEDDFCLIDDILPEHVYNCESYTHALLAADQLCPDKHPNGCFYCLHEKHID